MKVLFVFNHPAPYKVRLFNELAKSIDLFVIFERSSASDRNKDFYNCLELNFTHLIIDKCNYSNENTFTSEVKNYIKKHHYEFDLIIMNGYSTIAERKAIFYMKRKHINFTLYINGGVIRKENWLKRWYKTKIILSAKNYVSPCKEASKYLLHYGAKEKDIYHYPYSTVYEDEVLKTPLTKEEKGRLKEQYNLPKGFIFVSPSQFISRKNNIDLIKTFKGREELLLLIGDGPLLDEYYKVIKEENIQNVLIKNFVSKKELFEIMKACDAFITLSKEDIYGHTINEAFANGLPVISSKKVISSLHLIEEGKNGYLVDITSKDSIHTTIDGINKCDIESCLKTARKNTIEKSASKHIDIFKELIE